jgi:hypothetical protein
MPVIVDITMATRAARQHQRARTAARLRAQGYTREQASRQAARMYPEPEQPAEPPPASAEPASTAREPAPASANGRDADAGPSQREIRAWAKAEGIAVNPRGSVSADVRARYLEAHKPKGKGRRRR